jgi:hypothetical protein
MYLWKKFPALRQNNQCYTFSMQTPQVGEVWQHYKTKGKYEIVGLGQLQVKEASLDMKESVIYKAVLDGKLWVRPLEDFVEEIEFEGNKMPRFSKIR